MNKMLLQCKNMQSYNYHQILLRSLQHVSSLLDGVLVIAGTNGTAGYQGTFVPKGKTSVGPVTKVVGKGAVNVIVSIGNDLKRFDTIFLAETSTTNHCNVVAKNLYNVEKGEKDTNGNNGYGKRQGIHGRTDPRLVFDKVAMAKFRLKQRRRRRDDTRHRTTVLERKRGTR
jgi:hypothetical protein